jgi:hypothetical protein
MLGMAILSAGPTHANEVPEDLKAYLESQGPDRETKTLEQWLESHGTERPEKGDASQIPFLPEPPTQPNPMPELFQSSENKPLVLTLVHMMEGEAPTYQASGCAGKRTVDLLDDGAPPDTRPGDREYTGFILACPLGDTTVRIFTESQLLWSMDFEPKSAADSPSLRVLRLLSGFKLDTGTPEDPPQGANAPQPVWEAPTGEEGLQPTRFEDSPVPETKQLPAARSSAFWLGLAIGLGIALLVWLKSAWASNVESNFEEVEPWTHPPAPQPPEFLSYPAQGIHRLQVSGREEHRALSQALALEHCQTGTVLLLTHPANRKAHKRFFSQHHDVTWFKGSPPSLKEVLEVLNDLGEEVALVLIESALALKGGKQDPIHAIEALLGQIQQPVILLQRADENPPGDAGPLVSLVDNSWSVEERP